MAMNYKAIQSSLKTKEGDQLWYPKLVKEGGTIRTPQIAEIIASMTSLTEGDVYNSVKSLIRVMNDKLMNGFSVSLDELGTFTAIARAGGKGVKDPRDVNASQIKSLRIQFTPSYTRTPMEGVTRALLRGVEFRRWTGDPYHPQNLDENGNPKLPGNNNNGGGGDDGGGEDIVDPGA